MRHAKCEHECAEMWVTHQAMLLRITHFHFARGYFCRWMMCGRSARIRGGAAGKRENVESAARAGTKDSRDTHSAWRGTAELVRNRCVESVISGLSRRRHPKRSAVIAVADRRKCRSKHQCACFTCSPSRSRPKSPSKLRQTLWTWLASFCVLSYSRRKVLPCTR